MKFHVCRSSEGAVSKRPPCKGAVRGPEAPAWPGEHEWLIEVSTLEELMALLVKVGGAVALFAPEGGEEHPVIEILDENEEE